MTDIARLNGYKILGYLDDNEPGGEDREMYLGSIETLPRNVKLIHSAIIRSKVEILSGTVVMGLLLMLILK